ncbi:phosphatidylglycerophosphatase A [Salisediminibacterium halotolerans]|uniref:Phosphatidylglycerophosphatase A n=1 Tax=Salisediminibacterium halotolerans TaxID=517425 RepID=A0A1H9WHH9_9BACI|nr:MULTISPECIES: phosphatidylglycerophosphatase A [Salisediminibacterium]RLJ74383.1 phosphatidylglycerophosphatase A [Actinophytocola xinjiangensis]RPE87524.1 phosphatidylglycerophosphatase A [Salisediminibacterium halotolerans]TWG35220.1 phosphatidylglycerophosphatase A [Salisediminibacterium halotolerans]SES33305.1 Phosphatidylglycerophosphatase A [Salisediminibacterium haloalkalitolerans]GEL08149.1 phosphatidylglycerophosphatase A [Salisediminibacterium halotolerans]
MSYVNKDQLHCHVVENAARKLLKERGVEISDIAQIVYDMQVEFNGSLTLEDCIQSVDRVLEKREIQHAVLVGVELDKLAEQNQLSEPLQSIVASDEGLFGVDETVALGSVFGYGSIAVTTFGYLDKAKSGIIKELDTKESEKIHTFLDDLICSIAANASSRLAHRIRDRQEELREEEIEKRDSEERIG